MTDTPIVTTDFVHRLGALLDVPLVVSEPTPQYPQQGAEFCFPTGRRDDLSSRGNQAQLAKWRPGLAILAVMGGNVAVADVDPRNGGDIEQTRQMLDGLGVRIYAEVETPSGGRHFYIAGHPELASAHGLNGWPGIDVQSYGSLVFLPGTDRPKYGGAGYRVIFDNLEALADGGDPDGAAAFAGWVAEHRGKGAEFEPSPPWNGKSPDQRQTRYLQAMLDGKHRELAAMGKNAGRNTAVYEAGLKVGNYIAGAGLDEAHAVEILLDASRCNGLVRDDGESSVLASIRSGIRYGKARPRAVPDANGQAADGLERDTVSESTDDANALRLVAKHGARFRRVADMRRWFCWDGVRWELDHEDRAIREAARELARALPGGETAERSLNATP